jgi:hypothetical protein
MVEEGKGGWSPKPEDEVNDLDPALRVVFFVINIS